MVVVVVVVVVTLWTDYKKGPLHAPTRLQTPAERLASTVVVVVVVEGGCGWHMRGRVSKVRKDKRI
jgi:hypothetical protein